MSAERLQAGLAKAVPLLEKMKSGLASAPKASGRSLERLKKAASSARRTAAKPAQSAITADRVPEAAGASGRFANLDELRAAALACTRCPHLVRSRTQVVVGVGNPSADLLFVGEAPGADEDKEGEPFVGRAGQLLTKMIAAMGFTRDEIYIANVLKCRPDMPAGESGNRKPKPEEMRTCLPWLEEQIRLIRPKVMVALGSTAAEGLLETDAPMRDLRGRWHTFRDIPVMVTYHPAYLLRNQSISEKRKVWEDMLLVLEKLGVPISEKQRRYFTQAAE